MQKKKGLEYQNATDCATKPYHLLSTTIPPGDLMDYNPVNNSGW